MASLVTTRTGLRIPLRAETKVGRASTNQIRIPAPEVSNEHAVLRPNRGGWEVCDLGSRNGTLVNEDKLDPHVWRTLEAGDRLAFGSVGINYDFEEEG